MWAVWPITSPAPTGSLLPRLENQGAEHDQHDDEDDEELAKANHELRGRHPRLEFPGSSGINSSARGRRAGIQAEGHTC